MGKGNIYLGKSKNLQVAPFSWITFGACLIYFYGTALAQETLRGMAQETTLPQPTLLWLSFPGICFFLFGSSLAIFVLTKDAYFSQLVARIFNLVVVVGLAVFHCFYFLFVLHPHIWCYGLP